MHLLLSLLLSAPALAGTPDLPSPPDPRARAARQIIEDAGLDLGTRRLDDDEAIATAVLLRRDPDRAVRKHLRRAPDLEGDLLFSVKMHHGRVEQVSLVQDTAGDVELARRVAERLKKAKAGPDITADVFLPVHVGAPAAEAVAKGEPGP
jgi:hypothetical protein